MGKIWTNIAIPKLVMLSDLRTENPTKWDKYLIKICPPPSQMRAAWFCNKKKERPPYRIADICVFCLDTFRYSHVRFFRKSGHKSSVIFPRKKYGGEFGGSAFWSRIVKMGGWIRDKSQCTAYEVYHFYR